MSAPEPRDVAIRAGEEVIRLGQFLKLAGEVPSGAEAKELLAAEQVRVNGEIDVRRGRQLRRGDVVEVAGEPPLRVA